MSTYQEYLRNKDGEIFSPITSSDSVYLKTAGGYQSLTSYLTPKYYTNYIRSENITSTGAIEVITYGKLVQVAMIDCTMAKDITLNSSGWTNAIELVKNLPRGMIKNGNWISDFVVFDNYKYTQELVISISDTILRLQLRGVGSDFGTSPTVLPARRFNAKIIYISE